MSEAGIKKPAGVDGLVSHYLNRPLSRPAARLLAHTPMTPNLVTLLSLLLAWLGGWLMAEGYGIGAALVIHLSSVVDGVDGDLARLTGRATVFGGVFDAVLDRYADAGILGGMTWYAYRQEQLPASLLVGLAALTGSFAISYSRARAESSAGTTLTTGLVGLASRDVRLLLAAIACLLNRPYEGLFLLAILTNMIVAIRLNHLYRALAKRSDADAVNAADR